MRSHQSFLLIENQKAAEGVRILQLKGEIEASPGQFMMVYLPGVGERPFSVMKPRPLSFLIAERGKVSQALAQRKEGERVWVRGPYGKGFTLERGKMLLVAGGYGVSPLYFLARELIKKRGEVVFVLGAKTKSRLSLVEELEKLAVRLITVTEDGSQGEKGKATKIQAKLMRKERFSRVYGCGPVGMLEEMVKICRRRQTSFEVSLEREIRCGLGVCGHCAWGRYLICRDGPVFSFWPKNNFSQT